uniref:Uncharacterized protein n=1 Tax=Ditylenchus dipsaci TaxID=166011 RepID=A0A915EUE8_9BILA
MELMECGIRIVETMKKYLFQLKDDLLAVVGHDSGWRRGSCDIWDVATGECIYPAIEIFINPDGMEVTVAKGFLIVHSHCRGGSVYKVDKDNLSPIGEILVANRNLWVYTIGTDGTYNPTYQPLQYCHNCI